MFELAAHSDLRSPAPTAGVASRAPLSAAGSSRPRTGAGVGHRVLLDHLECRLDRLDAFADRVDQGFDGLERHVALAFAERRARSRTV